MPNRKKQRQAKKARQKLSSINKDAIQKSKQLSAKLQNSKRRNPKKHKKVTLGTSAPMPPLEELNAYYNNSESDKQSTSSCTAETNQEAKSTETLFEYCENLVSNSSLNPSNLDEEKSNMTKEFNSPGDKIMSQRTAAIIATKLLDLMSKVSYQTNLPSPSVVPQRRPKICGVPYIVGCKDRPQVIKKPTTNFCKGDDYGINMNASLNDETDISLQKQRHSSRIANVSKSIFNAKSNEIAARLKEADKAGTSYSSPAISGFKPFVPEPCSSNDIVTITKNDRMLHECLEQEKLYMMLQAKANSTANCIIVDDDSCDTLGSVILPKPMIDNDDCYIVEHTEQNKNCSINNFIIIDDDSKEDNIMFVENQTQSSGDLKIISIEAESEYFTVEKLKNDNEINVDEITNKKISVEKTVDTLQTGASSSQTVAAKLANKNIYKKKGELLSIYKPSIIRNCPMCTIDLKKCASVNVCGHSSCVKCMIASIKTIGHFCPVCKIPFA